MSHIVDQSLQHSEASTDYNNILLEPYHYLRANPGKEFRTKLIEAFDSWMNVPQLDLEVITKVTEMLHNASLLIDDVEDDSDLRRGIPVAHHIYGVAQTINCANYVYFLSLEEISKTGNPRMMHIFTEELLNLHRGQGLELYWRDTVTCPTEEQYLDMVGGKTCGLLRLAVKLMMEASKSEIDFIQLVNLIGIHFQIRDDYLNLKSDIYKEHKGFCEDMTEGKFSFPIIHSIRSAAGSDRQLLNILKQRTHSRELKEYALKIMERTGSFAYTREYLCKTEERVREELRNLGGNTAVENIMDMLSKL